MQGEQSSSNPQGNDQNTQAASDATAKPGFWKKLARIIVTVSLPLIAMGQWVDTRDLIIDSYQGFVTHFTDQVELNMLAEVRVGGNLDYLEEVFGVAKLIKSSATQDNLQYRYYHHPKFILTLAVSQNQVVGYTLTTLKADFAPPITFSDLTLGEQQFAEMQNFGEVFTADAANIHYYMEQKQLAREGLFYNRYLTHVEYGAETIDEESAVEPVAQQLNRIADAYALNDTDRLRSELTALRQQQKPNTYTLGQLTLEQAAETVLTRYEFKAYFGQGS